MQDKNSQNLNEPTTPGNAAPNKLKAVPMNIAVKTPPGAPAQVREKTSSLTGRKAAALKEIRAQISHKPLDYEAQARKRRRKRTISLIQKLFLFVVAPTIAASIYYIHFAHDQYMSTSEITIQSSSKGTVGIESLMGSFGSSSSSRDAMTVQRYILSRDMLRLLDKELQIVKSYKDPKIDILARLPQDASFEEAFDYYKKMVRADYDNESGVLVLEVLAFDSQSALQIARKIIEFSEDKVNDMSRQMQKDKITFTRGVVQEAEQRLANAHKGLMKIQQDQGKFNPNHDAQAIVARQTQLENLLVKHQTELSAARAVMSPTAPKVLELKSNIQAITRQLKEMKAQLLDSNETGTGLGQDMVDFQMATLERELSEKEYQSALISLETARLDALKQSSYLIEVSSPSSPDESEYPKRWLKILTAFFVSLAVFGIFSLLISAVKEHARI